MKVSLLIALLCVMQACATVPVPAVDYDAIRARHRMAVIAEQLSWIQQDAVKRIHPHRSGLINADHHRRAGLMLSVPTAVLALGLGSWDSNSSLKAKIPLVDAKVEELDILKVGLANRAQFKRAGLEFPLVLSDLRFELVQPKAGRDYVRIGSKVPIREPVLDFLIEVTWSKGRLVREYTVLLDPARYEPVASAPVHPPRSNAAAGSRGPASSRAGPRRVSPGDNGPYQYGPTQAGDTLWEITRDSLPGSGISVQQMMIALLKANPQAFIDGNINLLKQGEILRIPEAAALASITLAEALAEVRRQNALWQRYRGKLASSVRAASKDENSHLRERVKETEDLVELLRREIEIKDDELAALHAKLAQPQAQAPPTSEQPPGETPGAEPSASSALLSGADETTPSSEPQPPPAEAPGGEIVDAAPVEGAPLIPGGIYGAIGLVVVAGLIAFWVVWRMRARRQEAEVEVQSSSVGSASPGSADRVEDEGQPATVELPREPYAQQAKGSAQGVIEPNSTTPKDDFVVVEDLTAVEEVILVYLSDQVRDKTHELTSAEVQENAALSIR